MQDTVKRKGLSQLSPSKLSSFITCPTMFKARYILGIKSPPSASMVLGRAVHNALELLGRRRQMELEVSIDDLLTEFNEALKAGIEGIGSEAANGAATPNGGVALEVKPAELAKLREAGEQLIRIYVGRFGLE